MHEVTSSGISEILDYPLGQLGRTETADAENLMVELIRSGGISHCLCSNYTSKYCMGNCGGVVWLPTLTLACSTLQ